MLEQPLKGEALTMEQNSQYGVNQQGSSEKIAWLAGFTDGEGTITFNVNWQTKRYTPDYQICNTNWESLEECRRILDAHKIGYFIQTQKLNKNWKVVWKIKVSGFKRVYKLLKLLMPYLVTKKELGQLVYKFIDQRMDLKSHRGKPLPYTKDQIEMVKRVKIINSRKPSETLRLPTDK